MRIVLDTAGIPEDMIEAREFKHATHKNKYIDYKKGQPETIGKDYHFIKEVLHLKDGRKVPNLRVIEDFEREFFITKKMFRKHKQKKEAEDIDKLQRFTSTESDLPINILRKLGKYAGPETTFRDVGNNPYVYGASLSSEAILKDIYQKEYPDVYTPPHIVYMDIESYLNDDKNGEINLNCLLWEDRNTHRLTIKQFVLRDLVKDIKNPEEDIYNTLKDNLPDDMNIDDYDIDITVCETELELILKSFEQIHQQEPDFLTGWNFGYDMEYIIGRLVYLEMAPSFVLSDPRLPSDMKMLHFRFAKLNKKKQNGDTVNLKVEELWHIVRTASTYYVLDMMATFNFVRQGEKKMPGGLSLENVINKLFGYAKLKFSDSLPNLPKTDYHIYMTRKEPIKYGAYNIFDVIPLHKIEKKTQDISLSLPLLSGITSYDKFNSGPARIFDDFHLEHKKENRVTACLNYKNTDVDPNKVISRRGWTVTVESWKRIYEGINIWDVDGLESNVASDVSDSDQTSGYPSDTEGTNLSAETCIYEPFKFEGVDKDVAKEANLKIPNGITGHMQYLYEMHYDKDVDELVDVLEKKGYNL